MPRSITRQQKAAQNANYQSYLKQWGVPRGRFTNRYNLFYDLTLWDRRWLKKIRRNIAKRGPRMISKS
jgi:hypothetical protein